MSGNTGNTVRVPFAQRHAPQSFGDLVFEDANAKRHLALYANNHLHNSILLYGPYGTAKTTTALAIVSDRRRLTGCVGPYVHLYSGAQLSGAISQVVNSVGMMLSLEPDPHPYVIIDEVDQLTKGAQQGLRQALSTMSDLRVILTTNHIAKVDGGVQSRCHCIQLLPPTCDDWLPRAQAILVSEGVTIPAQRIRQLISGMSDIRHILRTLEALIVQSRLASGQKPPAGTPPTATSTLTVVPGNAFFSSKGRTRSKAMALTLPRTAALVPDKTTP